MRSFISSFTALLGFGCILLSPNPSGFAADWPQWRGPNRDGLAPDAVIPAILPSDLTLEWKVDVGEGYSSPVIVDERIYMLVRRVDEEVLVCVDGKNGEQLWATAFPVPFKVHPAAVTAGPGPKATCLVTDKVVIGFGITELLVAVDRVSGKLVWKHEFSRQFNPTWPETGVSASPLRVGETVIVPIGTKDSGGPAAFDLGTGKMIWKLEGDGPSYTSPDLFKVGDSEQLITFTQDTLVGLDPRKGRQLWGVPFKTPYGQNIVEPILIGNRLIYTGTEQSIRAVTIQKGQQGNYSTSPLWENKDHSCYMSQPIAIGENVLFHSEKQKGIFVCVDSEDGNIAWQSPPRMGDYISFSRVGDTIFALHNDATLRAIKADPATYQELGHWTIADGETWAWPAFIDSRVFVKDVKNLYCWNWRKGN